MPKVKATTSRKEVRARRADHAGGDETEDSPELLLPLHSKVETKTTEGSNMVETTAVGIETELTPIADPGD